MILGGSPRRDMRSGADEDELQPFEFRFNQLSETGQHPAIVAQEMFSRLYRGHPVPLLHHREMMQHFFECRHAGFAKLGNSRSARFA